MRLFEGRLLVLVVLMMVNSAIVLASNQSAGNDSGVTYKDYVIQQSNQSNTESGEELERLNEDMIPKSISKERLLLLLGVVIVVMLVILAAYLHLYGSRESKGF